MAKVYKTALGKQIDVDHLRLTNEHVIAVGNLKVNARGDELGPGGRVVKTRDQIMKEYYSLNTPVATDPIDDIPVQVPQVKQQKRIEPDLPPTPVIVSPNSGLDEVDDGPAVIPVASLPDPISTTPVEPAAIRGQLANAVAKTATVTQTPKLPPKKAGGVQRF